MKAFVVIPFKKLCEQKDYKHTNRIESFDLCRQYYVQLLERTATFCQVIQVA